jgi:hypothetical protein
MPDTCECQVSVPIKNNRDLWSACHRFTPEIFETEPQAAGSPAVFYP